MSHFKRYLNMDDEAYNRLCDVRPHDALSFFSGHYGKCSMDFPMLVRIADCWIVLGKDTCVETTELREAMKAYLQLMREYNFIDQ